MTPELRGTETKRGGRDRILRGSALFLLALSFLFSPAGEIEAQWLNSPGEGWLDLTVFFQDTDEVYELDGVRRDIFADGQARTLSFFLTGSFGILPGLDTWVQLPFHRLRFDDAGGERLSSGLGDPRLFIRVDPTLFRGPDFPIALRGGVKLDGGDFDVDAEIIPLGEGQRDWELILELGRSFHPRPLWVSGWVGHRWREDNEMAARNPGNEWFWWASAGGEVGRAQWQLALEGIHGDTWVIQGIPIRSARREILQVFPSIGTELLGGQLRVGTRTTLSGRNLPAGTALFSSFFRPFSLW